MIVPNLITDPWDKYFWGIAHSILLNSKCFSRKVGAILVREKSIVASGYNGPPKGVPHCDERWVMDDALKNHVERLSGLRPAASLPFDTCPRRLLGYLSGKGLEYCIAAHAEVNCIANAAMLGHEVLGTTMYMTCGIPYKDCLIVLINAGVDACVCTSLEEYDEETKFLLTYSNLGVREYK